MLLSISLSQRHPEAQALVKSNSASLYGPEPLKTPLGELASGISINPQLPKTRGRVGEGWIARPFPWGPDSFWDLVLSLFILIYQPLKPFSPFGKRLALPLWFFFFYRSLILLIDLMSSSFRLYFLAFRIPSHPSLNHSALEKLGF